MDIITTPATNNDARHKFPPTLLEQAADHLAQVEDVLLALVEDAASVDELLLEHQAGRLRGEFTAHGARNPLENPEAAFRRGYVHGMKDMGAALRDADLIDRKTLGKIADFIFGPIHRWRRGDQGRRLNAAPKLELGSNGGSHDQS